MLFLSSIHVLINYVLLLIAKIVQKKKKEKYAHTIISFASDEHLSNFPVFGVQRRVQWYFRLKKCIRIQTMMKFYWCLGHDNDVCCFFHHFMGHRSVVLYDIRIIFPLFRQPKQLRFKAYNRHHQKSYFNYIWMYVSHSLRKTFL